MSEAAPHTCFKEMYTCSAVVLPDNAPLLMLQMAAMDVLMKHEFLRVKLGEGCGLERKETAQQLADLLDSAIVGQVGFTITLYRKQGLPRPDNLRKQAAKAV